MKNLIKKVKDILTVLMKDYLKEFLFRVPIRSVIDAKLMDSENEFYATSQEEMKEFRIFHDRILSSNTIDSNC